MTRIVLTPEQLRLLAGTSGPVEVAGPGGEALGTFDYQSPERRLAAEAFRREAAVCGPAVSADRADAFMRKLRELRQGGASLDEAVMQDLLRRLQSGEAL
jgi:hypothetical protein